MDGEQNTRRANWLVAGAVFLAVLVAQLWLVAAIGTDVPFQDQWDVEGGRLYPAALDGTLAPRDLFRAHNEHRIVWTQGLDLVLFKLNGQWDPLVQLAAGAELRALVAALLVLLLARGQPVRTILVLAASVTLGALPLAGWHNALWGFQSQVYFAVLYALLAFLCLAEPTASWHWRLAGWASATAAAFSMGPGALVPVALLGMVALRAAESRRLDRAVWSEAVPALVLLIAMTLLRTETPEHDALRAQSVWQYLLAAGRLLAWPHVGQPLAALVLNVPIAIVVIGRILGKRRQAAGEDAVLLMAGWSVAIALAAAWTRGGSPEFFAGVPSRYVDFMVLLPLANVWCLAVLTAGFATNLKPRVRLLAAVWGGFLFIGWLGLSAEVVRGVIVPRMSDPEAPVRLARAFQLSGDANVFAGQPRLLVPHPNPETVRAVLHDPRMQGALPPSLQPERPMGPLSRFVRWLLRRSSVAAGGN